MALAASFFPLKDIPHHHGRVNAFQKGQCFFLVQSDVRDSRHTAKTHISIKYLTQVIAFAVFIKHLPVSSTQGADGFPNFKVVEIQELPERERQHFDLHVSSGEIGGIFGGKQVGV